LKGVGIRGALDEVSVGSQALFHKMRQRRNIEDISSAIESAYGARPAAIPRLCADRPPRQFCRGGA
jgi:hypothetical protein